MKKSTQYLGIFAAATTVAFLYKYSKEKGETMGEQQGINISVNPEKILKSRIDGLSPFKQNLIISLAQQGLKKILE